MILHIDMDAFFAAIEQRDNPDLKDKPVIISGRSKRSVVATASYEARKFGIGSAMPVYKALQLCDHLEIVPVNKKKYQAESKKIMKILARFSPLLEQVSIDEAYLDISGCERLFGSFRQIAITIKKDIYDHLSLTCSIGIAPMKFLSKIASDMNKPDGLTIVPESSVSDFISALPIGKVPGIGKSSMKNMHQLQIRTLGDVKKFSLPVLTSKFGKMGTRLMELSSGIDKSRVETSYIRKSISSEVTLSSDIDNFKEVKNIILERTQIVGRILRKKDLVCRNVFLKLKFSNFSQITRSISLSSPVSSSASIFNQALSLYKKIKLKKKIRLIGVGVSALQKRGHPIQMQLITDPGEDDKQWEAVDSAVDLISKKFGSSAINKASLTKAGKRRENMSENIVVKLTISGRVQGVFFRAETKKTADCLGITGFVKNLVSGSVEAVIKGDPAVVDEMIKWCNRGPAASKVDKVKVEKLQQSAKEAENFYQFEIRY